jgi:hypothetical protein
MFEVWLKIGVHRILRINPITDPIVVRYLSIYHTAGERERDGPRPQHRELTLNSGRPLSWASPICHPPNNNTYFFNFKLL